MELTEDAKPGMRRSSQHLSGTQFPGADCQSWKHAGVAEERSGRTKPQQKKAFTCARLN